MVGKNLSSLGGSWARSSVTATATNGLAASIAANADGYALDFTKTAYSASMTNVARYDFGDIPESNAIHISFTVTPGPITVDSTSGDIYYEFQFYGVDENGGHISTNMNFMRMFGGTDQITAKALRVRHQMANADYFYDSNAIFGETIRFDFDYNFKGKELIIYRNGTKVQTVELMKGQANKATGLSRMTFNILRNGVTGSYRFDDFVVSAKKADLIANNLSAADGGALKAEVNGSKKQISVTSKYNEENSLTQTFGVYTASNQHIEYYDAYLTNESGAITYLWEQGQGRTNYVSDESAPLNINGTFVGGNHAAYCVKVTKEGHGKTVADVGTLWKASDGKEWVLAQVVDKNSIKFLSVDHDERPTQSWVFSRSIASGDLTRMENGEETTEKLSFTKQGSDQLFPAVRNSVQTVTAYMADGSTRTIDLAISQSIKADKIVIVDSYEIIV